MAPRVVAVNGNRARDRPGLAWQILEVLSALDTPGSLGGGSALSLVYLRQPAQRIDLFWREIRCLGCLPREVERLLTDAGMQTYRVQSYQTLTRMRVERAGEVCCLNLVAEPGAPLEAPAILEFHGNRLRVDTPREILAQTLCASALRIPEAAEVEALRRLLGLGTSLDLALVDARYRDPGYAALQLAWNLRDFALRPPVHPERETAEAQDELRQFAAVLVRSILRGCFSPQIPC